MPDLGKAYVQIVPSAKGMSGNLKKELEGTGTESGGSFATAFGAAAKKLMATLAIGATIKKSLDLGGELQQNLGGTEAVFGNFAKSVQDKATEAYKNMGMSASDYMATANKMGSLFQGSGLEQQRALELTTQAMQRAADVASVMGIDTSAAMESIAGAAKGNFTMMDNLGVAMNATTLEAYALEKGVNFKWNTASNAEKAELAMQMFMERTAQYEGNFAKESNDTFSGSLNAMKSAAQNFMANLSLGRDITGPLTQMIETAKTFLIGNLIPMVGNIIKSLPTALTELQSIGAELINELVTGIKNNGAQMITAGIELAVQLATGLIQNASVLLEGAISALGAIIQAVSQVDWKKVGSDILNAIKGGMESISKSLFGDGKTLDDFLAGINAKLPDVLDKGIEIISNVVSGIMSALPDLVSKAGEVILSVAKAMVASMPTILDKGKELIKRLLTGITQSLPELGTKAGEIIGKFGRYLLEHGPEILQKGIELMGELIAGIIKAIPDVLKALVNLGKSMAEQFDDVDWAEVGQDILAGIAEGLVNIGDTLLNAVTEAGKAIWEGFKSYFQIASPSKLMKGLGINIIEGIINGLKDTVTLGNVLSAAKSVFDKITSGLNVDGFLQKGKDIVGKVASGLKDSPTLATATAAAQAVMTAVGNAFAIAQDNPFYKAGTGVVGQLVSGLNSQSKSLDSALNSIVAKFTSMANQAQAQANKANAAANSNNLSNNPIAARIGGSLSEESNNTSEIADLLYTFLPIIAQNGNMDGMYDALNRQFGWGIS